MQKTYTNIIGLIEVLNEHKPSKVLLVCDQVFDQLAIKDNMIDMPCPFVVFNSFTANPLYEDVVKGVQAFRNNLCDFIIAVGGGSAIDVAKCIKLFCSMKPDQNYLEQKHVHNTVPLLLAVPTTAGTGSESTRFAVIYWQGEKQSVFHDVILPDYVILDGRVLESLPIYQKKCTLLDALCQAIESWWSINSNDNSIQLSKLAVRLILDNMKDYLDGTGDVNDQILKAANLAGQAINMTQTTAAHAMSYKLTSRYGLPHGHAVALCLPAVWHFMLHRLEQCRDIRGIPYLLSVFCDIASALGQTSPGNAIEWFNQMLLSLQILPPLYDSDDELNDLARTVNPTRLKNNPVIIDKSGALKIYKRVLISKRSEMVEAKPSMEHVNE